MKSTARLAKLRATLHKESVAAVSHANGKLAAARDSADRLAAAVEETTGRHTLDVRELQQLDEFAAQQRVRIARLTRERDDALRQAQSRGVERRQAELMLEHQEAEARRLAARREQNVLDEWAQRRGWR